MHQGNHPLLVAGADGCRAGWVLARAVFADGLHLHDIAVVPNFADLLARTRDCAAVSVDIPIGLSDDGLRAADFAARRFIGPRRSSVFPTPARPLVEMTGDYAALNQASKLIRAGISRQTFNILAKIREADRSMTPDLQSRVTESHPEVSFCALAGCHLRYPKLRREGLQERLALLEPLYGHAVHDLRPPAGAALDDVLDAVVLSWTAARVASGEAVHFPSEPELDARGLRMEIVY